MSKKSQLKCKHKLRPVTNDALNDIGISLYKEIHFINEYTKKNQVRCEPDTTQNKRLYKIVRSLTGDDQVIVLPSGSLKFNNKYYSHSFFNMLSKNAPNTGVNYMTLNYKTRLCICGFFDNKPFKHDEKEFYTIPAILDLSKTDAAIKKDIKAFLERSPYA